MTNKQWNYKSNFSFPRTPTVLGLIIVKWELVGGVRKGLKRGNVAARPFSKD